MLIQVLFTLCIMLTTIQTVIDLRDRELRVKDLEGPFSNSSRGLPTTVCKVEPDGVRLRRYFDQTCPIEFNPACNDPIFNKYREFEYTCRYPMMATSIFSMNETGFLDLWRSKDLYGRDWCMIVMFYSENCPFSSRLAPHFNSIAGKFENIIPIVVDASDLTKSYRLNFRFGISGTPTVLLYVNGLAVARMGSKELDATSIKNLIISHTDLIEKREGETKPHSVPSWFYSLGVEIDGLTVNPKEDPLTSALYAFACFFVLLITFIYHVRERILLSAPVLRWFQSKCGIALCDDIYFLFYVATPRNQNRGAPRPPPEPPRRHAAPQAPPAPLNEEIVELPPLVIEDQ